VTRSNVAIASVPAHDPGEATPPARCVCRVLVSGAHAAALYGVEYARLLGIEDTKALFFPFDEDEGRRVAREWSRREIELELVLDDAPYRDIAVPLLRELRVLTSDPATVAVLVVPELVVGGWRKALHNRHAAYVRRVVRGEPRVILTQVPYQL
jgi:hypothetical protein